MISFPYEDVKTKSNKYVDFLTSNREKNEEDRERKGKNEVKRISIRRIRQLEDHQREFKFGYSKPIMIMPLLLILLFATCKRSHSFSMIQFSSSFRLFSKDNIDTKWSPSRTHSPKSDRIPNSSINGLNYLSSSIRFTTPTSPTRIPMKLGLFSQFSQEIIHAKDFRIINTLSWTLHHSLSRNRNLYYRSAHDKSLMLLTSQSQPNNENNDGTNDENDHPKQELDQNRITDLTLSEFLKKQQEKQSSKSITGGIRDRVKGWLKRKKSEKDNIADDMDDSESDEVVVDKSKDTHSPRVQPIALDGSVMFDDESNLIEDEDIFDIDSEVDNSSTDIDERMRIKNKREEQKAKRLQKIMNELQFQLENSPDEVKKNIKDTNNDDNDDRDKSVVQDKTDNKGRKMKTNIGKKKVIRPNFDELFKDVPGLDDLLGDIPSAPRSDSLEEKNDKTNTNTDEKFNEPQNLPLLDKDGSIQIDSIEPKPVNSEDSLELDNEEDEGDIPSGEEMMDDILAAQEQFLALEQEMRKRSGLTKRSDNNKNDEENTITDEKEERIMSKEEINLEALDTLEKLRRKRFGDKYTESSDMKSVRDVSSESIVDDENISSDAKKNEEREEKSAEMRFREMEQEMRKKTGLASRRIKEDDDESKDKQNKKNVKPKDPSALRAELSSSALSTLEQLRKKKLGDSYTELDKEEIIQKMKELTELDENDRELMQNDDTFLGDDEIALWDMDTTTPDDIDDEDTSVISLDDDDADVGAQSKLKKEKKGSDLFAKKATITDQMYRTIAAKGGGKSDTSTRSDWETYLEKEAEMRKKMGMIDSGIDDSEPTESMQKAPNSEIFSEDNNIDDMDLQSEEANEDLNEDLSEDLNEDINSNPSVMKDLRQAPLSSQIYRSIAAKKAVKGQGTEADFQAYFEKEAEMRKKMGMASSYREGGTNSDGTVDLSSIFEEAFDDDAIRGSTDDINVESPFEKNYEDDESKNDSDLSVEDWIKAKEASLNLMDDEDEVESDIDNCINSKDVSLRSEVAEENENMQGKPNTPFFQDYVDDDNGVDDEEEVDKNEIFSKPKFTSSKYAYDPEELSNIFEKDVFPEEDFYMDKITSDSFYIARKNELLERTELAVQDLNALGEFDPMAKLSMKMKPDSAFGSIFRLEGTLVDTTEMHMEAWTKVAEQHDFEPPSWEEVQGAQLVKADDAVRSIFFWSFDIMESRDIALSHYDALQEIFNDWMTKYNETDTELTTSEHSSIEVHLSNTPPLFVVNEGVHEWLERLRDSSMPCAVMSQLDRTKLDSILHATNLDEFFPEDKRVSANCGYNRESQEMLGAALRIQRRPDHCAVFDTSPSSSVSAHDVEMKSVALMGLYARYELNTADLTVSDFDDMSVINIRRLFSDENFDEPVLELEKERPDRDPPNEPRVRTWAEGDRF